MKKDKRREDYDDGKMRMDGYNDCICGTVSRFGMEDIVCYDLQKVIKKLQKDGMTREEAYEF